MNGISVNTNSGALESLQYLNMTNAGLNSVQNAVNSGMTVADAKDNGAIFAIAQNMRGDVAGYSSVSASLSRGTSSVDVALSAGQSISDLLIQMKSQALSASDSSLDTASRQATGSISTQSKASTMIATVEASLTNVDAALSTLSSGAAKFSIQSSFVSQLSSSLTEGIGNLVDADMATESAQLNALQVKQQLGVQALSIANSAPQIALKLFG
jgi:flagellin